MDELMFEVGYQMGREDERARQARRRQVPSLAIDVLFLIVIVAALYIGYQAYMGTFGFRIPNT